MYASSECSGETAYAEAVVVAVQYPAKDRTLLHTVHGGCRASPTPLLEAICILLRVLLQFYTCLFKLCMCFLHSIRRCACGLNIVSMLSSLMTDTGKALTSAKYPGVTITEDLKCGTQIQNTYGKANRTIGFM